MTAKQILVNLVIKNNGNWESTYEDITSKNYPDDAPITCNVISILDDEYPSSLKQGHKPPFALFYEGNTHLLQARNIVGITSTKLTSAQVNKYANALDDTNVYVISASLENMAMCLLEQGKQVIVVAPNGLDMVNLPLKKAIEARNGLLVSEYPLGVEKSPEIALFTTRLISGLSHKVVVLLAKEGQNQPNLVISNALSNGKDVYVAPTDIDSGYYNNNYILEGAIPFIRSDQLQPETY